MRLVVENHLLEDGSTFFDYGCGHGDDLARLDQLGTRCWGWDPVHRPNGERHTADIVNLGYVVNVIEDAEERAGMLREAWKHAKCLLVVSARLDLEAKGLCVWTLTVTDVLRLHHALRVGVSIGR